MERIELGSDIIGSDGEKLGEVDSLVVDPADGRIISVIVRKGFFFPTDKIVPADAITTVGDDEVHISMSSAEVENLTEYMDTEYVWPPAGYYGNYGYMWPATSIYSTDLMIDEQVHQRDPNAVILSEGTLVVDRNNDELGRIIEIVSDDRGRVTGFKVEEGLFRHHEHYIPANVVATANDTVVQLSVDKDRLEQVTGPEGSRRYA